MNADHSFIPICIHPRFSVTLIGFSTSPHGPLAQVPIQHRDCHVPQRAANPSTAQTQDREPVAIVPPPRLNPMSRQELSVCHDPALANLVAIVAEIQVQSHCDDAQCSRQFVEAHRRRGSFGSSAPAAPRITSTYTHAARGRLASSSNLPARRSRNGHRTHSRRNTARPRC